MNFWTRKDTLGALGVVALVMVIYLPGLDAGYYADDFQFYFGAADGPAWQAFVRPNTDNMFYRPIEAICLGWIQSRWGLDPRPVHAAILALHLGTCFIVGLAGRRLGLGPTGAWSAAAVMGGSQAAVHAVQSLDTLSQVGATFFGLQAIAAVAILTRDGPSRLRSLGWAGAVPAQSIALLFKESGISALPGQLLLLARAEPGNRVPRSRVVIMTLSLGVVVAAYLVVRGVVVGAGPAIGAGRYDFHTGLNIPRNLALLGFSAILPTSSVRLFLDAQADRWVPVILALAGAGVVATLLIVGCWHSGRRALWTWWVMLGIVATFPMVLLNHVSELYTYNLLPFVGLIAGLASETLLDRSGPRQRRLIVALLIGILATHVVAARGKADLMEARGAEAARLLGDLRINVQAAPSGSAFRIVDAARSPDPAYSVFLMPPLDLLLEGPHGLARAIGRPDLELRFGSTTGLDPVSSGGDGEGDSSHETVLVIKDGRMTTQPGLRQGGNSPPFP